MQTSPVLAHIDADLPNAISRLQDLLRIRSISAAEHNPVADLLRAHVLGGDRDALQRITSRADMDDSILQRRAEL
ncbi:MAG: hypothetical protein ACO37E_06130, partial [Lutimaribacter sp.]